MSLHDQGRAAPHRDEGYAMAALLVAISIMAVALTVALPAWTTAVRREKEAELIFRGQQYARAIGLFQQKYANAYPPNLDILLNERFLRKKYKDPMTKDGEFQLLYIGSQAAAAPGQVPQQARPGMPAPAAPTPAPARGIDAGSQISAGARGGIIGVVSKSTESSLRLYNNQSKYNQWSFVWQPALTQVTAPGGQARPGMPPGTAPGTARPGTAPPRGPGEGRPPGFPKGPPGTSPFVVPPARPPQN